MIVISGDIVPILNVSGNLGGIQDVSGDISVPEAERTPEYTGAYTFTPSSSEQTLAIAGMKATQNITINPIPDNYGLITWNGSVLTVS